MIIYYDYLENEIVKMDLASDNWLEFVDEVDFQKVILNRSVPLIIGETVFHPLVTEFPASPGIDIIYFSEDGRLLITELKHNKYNRRNIEKEISYKIESTKSRTVRELINYGKSNPKEVDSKRMDEFEHLFAESKSSTFEHLCKLMRLEFACIVYGDPKYGRSVNYNFPIIGIKFNEKYLLQNSSEYQLHKNYYDDNIVGSLASRYEKELVANKKRRAARSQKPSSIGQDKLQQKYKNLLDLFSAEMYSIKFGTGSNPTINIKFPDSERKMRTIVYLNHTGICVPGNLYNQQEYLGVERTDIDQLFENLEKLLDGSKFRYTDSRTLRILNVDWGSKHFLEDLYNILNSFVSKCRESCDPPSGLMSPSKQSKLEQKTIVEYIIKVDCEDIPKNSTTYS
jgi:hypothetical protein